MEKESCKRYPNYTEKQNYTSVYKHAKSLVDDYFVRNSASWYWSDLHLKSEFVPATLSTHCAKPRLEVAFGILEVGPEGSIYLP